MSFSSLWIAWTHFSKDNQISENTESNPFLREQNWVPNQVITWWVPEQTAGPLSLRWHQVPTCSPSWERKSWDFFLWNLPGRTRKPMPLGILSRGLKEVRMLRTTHEQGDKRAVQEMCFCGWHSDPSWIGCYWTTGFCSQRLAPQRRGPGCVLIWEGHFACLTCRPILSF